LFSPFSGLVKAYGLPGYGEVDPTVFAGVIYVLMFGAMFGDAGHGAVVCAGGAWLALKGRGAARAAGRMAVYCGLSGIAFGLVYGSFFGLESFKKYALWRDPLTGDPLVMVLAALAAGAVVISIGVVLNIINRAASGDLLGAALGRFGVAGLLFYWCAILMLAGKIEPRFGFPVLGAALFCWALKEPLLYLAGRGEGHKAESALEVAAEALVGALEGALLYLANTVSFARLAAYAMSHAALLAAAYMLAAAADKTWGSGSAAGAAAIIAGNAAAIILEGVVAAVQALRLEYYEFFGKFFEGGGRPFKPFALDVTGGIK
jgi:V/A-type H+-transporting ATPase subunit I